MSNLFLKYLLFLKGGIWWVFLLLSLGGCLRVKAIDVTVEAGFKSMPLLFDYKGTVNVEVGLPLFDEMAGGAYDMVKFLWLGTIR